MQLSIRKFLASGFLSGGNSKTKAPLFVISLINYFSDKIMTDKDNSLLKEDIIKHSETGNLYEPKSTKHLIFCNESKKWHPITLVSSLYNLSLK